MMMMIMIVLMIMMTMMMHLHDERLVHRRRLHVPPRQQVDYHLPRLPARQDLPPPVDHIPNFRSVLVNHSTLPLKPACNPVPPHSHFPGYAPQMRYTNAAHGMLSCIRVNVGLEFKQCGTRMRHVTTRRTTQHQEMCCLPSSRMACVLNDWNARADAQARVQKVG